MSLFFHQPAMAGKEKKEEKKKEKTKKIAVVSPTTQNKPSENDAVSINTKSKLQSELEAENALNRVRLEQKLSTIIAQIEQLRLEKERHRLNKEVEDEKSSAEHYKAMRLLTMEKERLTMELEISQARFMKQMEEYNIQLTRLDKKIQLEKGQAQLLQETKNRLQAEIEALQAQAIRTKHIDKKPVYLKDPLNKKNNTLILSDRCIELTGYITPWKANYIIDQIHYFNNKSSDYPIFLIIGNSPGGSVIAGYDILQTISNSKAPVYVVVKSFAASMAALITTLATKSYAYPNALILHHQPSGFVWGNLRHTKEHYEFLDEIWKRLGGKVAKKMGISLKAFDKKLYEKSMYGDWEEYGDNAKKLKWVDYVVSAIQDTSISTLPDAEDYSWKNFLRKYYYHNTDPANAQDNQIDYQALAPHDFNYSYDPHKKAEMLKLSPHGTRKVKP